MTELDILFGVIAVVWAGVFLLRGSIVAGCVCVVLLGACFGYEFFHVDAGGLPLTSDRVALALLIGAYIVQRGIGRIERRPIGTVEWLLLALVALMGVNTFCTTWDDPTHRSMAIWRLVAGYVIPVSLYWIARHAPYTERSMRWFQGALACFGVYLGVTAFFEITKVWPLVYPTHIADRTVGLHFGRARGPMVHSVSFGLFLAVCLMAAWMWRRQLGQKGRTVMLCLLPLFLAGIFFSYTRSVWMGTAAGSVTVLALTLTGRWRTLFLGSVATAGLMISIVDLESFVAFERERSANNTKQSAELRASFAYVSWNMFLDRPLLGVGFGQFFQEKKDYLADRSTDLLLSPIREWSHHNTLLSLLTETGIIGLGLFLAVLGGWARAGYQLWRNPNAPPWARDWGALVLGVLAAYLPQLLFHELSYASLDNSLVFCIAGLTMGLSRSLAAGEANPPDAAARQRDVDISQLAAARGDSSLGCAV